MSWELRGGDRVGRGGWKQGQVHLSCSALASTKPQQVKPSAHLYDPDRTYLQSEMMNFSWTWPANFLPDLAQYTSASTLRMEMFCGKESQASLANHVFADTCLPRTKCGKMHTKAPTGLISGWWDCGPFLFLPWLSFLNFLHCLTLFE